MNNTSQITIVIPAYNSVGTIIDTLHSLDCQSCKDFGLVVVEDGFDDDQFLAIDKNWPRHNGENDHVILSQNVGPGEARNRGLKSATAPYVMFLDSDDVLMPHAIQTLTAALSGVPDYVVGKTLREGPNNTFEVIGHEQVTWLHGRVYRKAFLDIYSITFPELRMSEDLAFNALCAEFAKAVPETNLPVHMQRYHVGSLSRSRNSEILQARTYIKACLHYLKTALEHREAKDLLLLPQMVAMCYFYLDYVASTGSNLYLEMCADFADAVYLADLPALLPTAWYDKLNDALLIPVRPYQGKRLAPALTFEQRYTHALNMAKDI